MLEIKKDIETYVITITLFADSTINSFFDAVTKDHFEDLNTGKCYETIKNYFLEYNKIPTAKTFARKAEKEGISHKTIIKIIGLFKDLKNEPLEFYIDEIKKHLKEVVIRKAVVDSMDLIDEGLEDGIEDLIRQALANTSEFNHGLNYYNDIERRYETVSQTFQTGWPSWDRFISGGWKKKKVYAIMSPSAYGKSIFLGQMALKLSLANLKVVFFTLELDEDDIANRLDCSVLKEKFDISKINDLEAKLEKIKTTTLNGKSNLMIKKMSDVGTSITHLRNYVEQLEAKYDFVPDVIVLDYIDLIDPTHQKKLIKSKYDSQGMAVREFRAWCGTGDYIGLTATQSQRLGKDQSIEDMDENNIGDSYEIVRGLDFLATIVQTPSEKQKEFPTTNLKIIKNRFGPSLKKIHFNIDYNTMTLTEISKNELLKKK